MTKSHSVTRSPQPIILLFLTLTFTTLIHLKILYKYISLHCRLSEQQLDARRRGLEQYLEKVCAVRVIAESDAMQEFLTDRLEEDGDQGPAVDLKVLLPDRDVVTVTVAKAASAKDVYDAVCCRVGLDSETAKYFYLFEIVEYNFGMCKNYLI